MKVTWLGQAGLLVKAGGLTVMIDPYLSNSVGKQRYTPIDESVFTVKPDVMVFTHDHLDHYDTDTVPHFLGEGSACTVLAPKSAWQKARTFGGANNYVQFDRHTRWTEGVIRFTAVKAVHSDDYAIGVIIDDGKKKLYITGDTLYNEEIFADLPKGIHAVFLPINGAGNNMNMTDAADFAKRTKASIVVPIHYGMFDTIDPAAFAVRNKKILKVYEETEL